MIDNIKNFNPIFLTFLATLFTWAVTALGASLVFFQKKPSRRVFDCSLGFAGGVMVAASFFSLLLPAVEFAGQNSYLPTWFIVSAGFIVGCLFLYILDRLIPHLHPNMEYKDREGCRSDISLSYLIVLAITLHNIPEGLAVGVAFGSLKFTSMGTTIFSAVSLALAIGLQNFPEGMAVSVPLRGTGVTKSKAFFFGQLPGMVEPLAGVMGAVAVTFFRPLLPYALAFAAGAMIYIVVEEVVPETQRVGNTDVATLSFFAGFIVMMIMDIGLP